MHGNSHDTERTVTVQSINGRGYQPGFGRLVQFGLFADPDTGSGSATAGVESGTASNDGGTNQNTQPGNQQNGSGQGTAAPVAGYDLLSNGAAGNAQGQNPGGSNASVIPEAYKDKPWVAKFVNTADPISEVFKSYENLEKLISQRPPVNPPGADASPEQVKAWRKYIGLPDDSSSYKYEPPKFEGDDAKLYEYIAKERPAEFMSKMAQKAHEIGLSPQQFQAMAEYYEREYHAANKQTILEMQQADTLLNQDFETKTAQVFGDRKDAVLRNGKNLIDQIIPADSPMRVWMNQFNNEQLAVVAAVAGTLHEKFVKEDSFGSKQVGAGAVNREQVEAEITSLMSQDAFSNFMHADHAKVNARINSLYEQLGLHGAVRKV